MAATKKRGVSTTSATVDDASELASELDAIKRLLMLFLVKLGSTSEEIAAVLEVDASAVRRLVPSRKIRRLTFPTLQGDAK